MKEMFEYNSLLDNKIQELLDSNRITNKDNIESLKESIGHNWISDIISKLRWLRIKDTCKIEDIIQDLIFKLTTDSLLYIEYSDNNGPFLLYWKAFVKKLSKRELIKILQCKEITQSNFSNLKQNRQRCKYMSLIDALIYVIEKYNIEF